MGLRDDHVLDDEHADAALRRVLSAIEPPSTVAPPPDLLLRATSRLPAAPPVEAAQALERRHARRRLVMWCVLTPVVLIALLSLVGVVGWGTELALMIGNGESGLSRELLMLHLLAKPVLWTVSGIHWWLLVAIALVVAAGIGLWWRTLQRTPAYPVVEDE